MVSWLIESRALRRNQPAACSGLHCCLPFASPMHRSAHCGAICLVSTGRSHRPGPVDRPGPDDPSSCGRTSRLIVLRCRPSARAIAAWLHPCFLSAESAYRSPEVSWRYLFMNFLLFVEKEGLGRPSSPQLLCGVRSGGLLHLLYESKPQYRGRRADLRASPPRGGPTKPAFIRLDPCPGTRPGGPSRSRVRHLRTREGIPPCRGIQSTRALSFS